MCTVIVQLVRNWFAITTQYFSVCSSDSLDLVWSMYWHFEGLSAASNDLGRTWRHKVSICLVKGHHQFYQKTLEQKLLNGRTCWQLAWCSTPGSSSPVSSSGEPPICIPLGNNSSSLPAWRSFGGCQWRRSVWPSVPQCCCDQVEWKTLFWKSTVPAGFSDQLS